MNIDRDPPLRGSGMRNRAAPLMAKMLAECGDGEWRTINAIAERAGLSAESAWGVIKEHQTPAAGDG